MMKILIKSQALGHRRPRYSLGALSTRLSLGVLMIVAGATHAEAGPNSHLSSLNAVADVELAPLRGGFRTAEGFEVRLGFRSLVTSDEPFQGASPSNTAELAAVTQTANLPGVIPATDARNGPPPILTGNFAGPFSLIQNHLDNQRIQAFSVLDIQVLNLFTLRSTLPLSRWIAESARHY
ncbi:MAG: hypothetical protein ACFCVA_02080 [Gammaproteobacteria bacterium]